MNTDGMRKLANVEVIRGGDFYEHPDSRGAGSPVSATIGFIVAEALNKNATNIVAFWRSIRIESPGWRYLDEGETPRYGSDEYQWLGGPYKVAEMGSRRVPGTSNESAARVDGGLRRVMRRRWPEAPTTPAAETGQSIARTMRIARIPMDTIDPDWDANSKLTPKPKIDRYKSQCVVLAVVKVEPNAATPIEASRIGAPEPACVYGPDLYGEEFEKW